MAATQNTLEAFIWGAGGSKKTPEEIARDKEIAAEMLMKAGNTSPVEHWTQGAARVADALSGVIKQKRAERAGEENATYNQGILSELFKGKSAQPAATPSASATIPDSGASAEMAASAPSQPLDMTGNEVYSGFMDTVKTAVQNPYALAAIAATGKAESGFSPKNATRTWSDPSQSGQPGTAGGIMSWRGPRYNALAATGDLSPAGQAKFFLQEDPQLIAALNKAGSVEEAQRLMNNAWAFAGYDQPGGEAARRLQTANGFLPTFQGAAQPTQVASLDPSVGMTSPAVTAIEEQAPGGMGAPLTDQSFDNRFGQTPLPADVLQGKDSLVSALTETNGSGIPQPANIPLPVAADRSQTPAQQPTAVQQVAQALPAAGQAQQAVPGMSEALLRAISDPRATPQTRAVVQALMQQEQAKQAQAAEQQQWMARQQYEQDQKRNDPATQLDMQYKQAQLDALKGKPTEPAEVQTLRIRAQEAGLKPGTPEYAQFMTSGGKQADSITINNGEGNKFYNKLDEKNAEVFSGLSETGITARSNLAMVDRLGEVLSTSPQGAEAAIKRAAGEFGIPTEGLDSIQAATALINRLVPQQRQPGSGTMSDADLELFKGSLPRIINQPGGNEAIIQDLKAISEYQVSMGAIADQVADRALTPEQGREAIRKLPNPLQSFLDRKRTKELDDQDEGWSEVDGIRIRKKAK
jgi:hypothetical protein